MDKRIVYGQADGTVAIVVPSPEYKGTMADLAKDVIPDGVANEIVDVADIPTDRTFRNAWEHDVSTAPEKIKTNMGKAKEIAHGMRRAERDELFKPLDVQATIPSQATAAEQARQAIRNADAQRQIDIDAATDEATLKTLVTTPLAV